MPRWYGCERNVCNRARFARAQRNNALIRDAKFTQFCARGWRANELCVRLSLRDHGQRVDIEMVAMRMRDEHGIGGQAGCGQQRWLDAVGPEGQEGVDHQIVTRKSLEEESRLPKPDQHCLSRLYGQFR